MSSLLSGFVSRHLQRTMRTTMLTFMNHSYTSWDPRHERFKISTRPSLGVSIPRKVISVWAWVQLYQCTGSPPSGFYNSVSFPAPPCTAMKIPIYVFLFLGNARPQSQFPHSCLGDLYYPRIGPHISCSRIGRSIVGSLTATWMWNVEIRTVAAQSLFWEYLFRILGIGSLLYIFYSYLKHA